MDPKPLIEDHYHIAELIGRQQKRTDDRNYHRDVQKERQERQDIINDAKIICATDFYCRSCRQDFKAMAVKTTEVDWSCLDQNMAFYKAKCDEGHWCIRLITDRHKDAFWVKSKLMAIDRGSHYADTVQPHETGFNLLYGKK